MRFWAPPYRETAVASQMTTEKIIPGCDLMVVSVSTYILHQLFSVMFVLLSILLILILQFTQSLRMGTIRNSPADNSCTCYQQHKTNCIPGLDFQRRDESMTEKVCLRWIQFEVFLFWYWYFVFVLAGAVLVSAFFSCVFALVYVPPRVNPQCISECFVLRIPNPIVRWKEVHCT